MITAQELKEQLSDTDILELLSDLGATIYEDNREYIITDTICHCGCKPKLYYYKSTKMFHCYTECGSLDVITLASNVKNSNFITSLAWLTNRFNLNNGFKIKKAKKINDWNFIHKHSVTEKNNKETKIYDKCLLNCFQDIYYQQWVDENISIQTMQKYMIKANVCYNQIIIPHFNLANEVVGIRARNLNEIDIQQYGKYIPYTTPSEMYNHALGDYLYGLNFNIENIKKKRKVILFEGEKSVMQYESLFPDNISVAVCGSNLSDKQKQLIIELHLNEVIVAVDKQYKYVNSDEFKKWVEHIKKQFVKPLINYVKVSVMFDLKGRLEYKDSPIDKGKETFNLLYNERLETS